MTYLGTIKNGVVIIEGGAAIADGTPVRIETIRPAGGGASTHDPVLR